MVGALREVRIDDLLALWDRIHFETGFSEPESRRILSKSTRMRTYSQSVCLIKNRVREETPRPRFKKGNLGHPPSLPPGGFV
jgi:hypothetical protein